MCRTYRILRVYRLLEIDRINSMIVLNYILPISTPLFLAVHVQHAEKQQH